LRLPANAWHLIRGSLGLSSRERQIVQCVFEDENKGPLGG